MGAPVAARVLPLARRVALAGAAIFLSSSSVVARRRPRTVSCTPADHTHVDPSHQHTQLHTRSTPHVVSTRFALGEHAASTAAAAAVFAQAAAPSSPLAIPHQRSSPACSRSRRARNRAVLREAGEDGGGGGGGGGGGMRAQDAAILLPVALMSGMANLIDDIKQSTRHTLAVLHAKHRSLTAAAARAAASTASSSSSSSSPHSSSHLSSRRNRSRTATQDDPNATTSDYPDKHENANSPLRDPSRAIAIVTTAVLPWMTGTAVNPLLRAAYLAGDPDDGDAFHRTNVTLLVPWVPLPDQRVIYPSGLTFDQPRTQETYIRDWVVNRLGFAPNFKIAFYPGRYDPDKGSILAVGDITRYIPENDADIAILEEPEHLNWFHSGRRWSDKFNYVLGIVHTNYLEYIRRQKNGPIMEQWVKFYNQCVVRQHCHRIVKLSGAVQDFPRSTVSYVHGVSPTFLDVGRRIALAAALPSDIHTGHQADSTAVQSTQFTKSVYFLGKVLWGKGYSELLTLVDRHVRLHGSSSLGPNGLDVFGSGDDLDAVTARSCSKNLPLNFHGPKDHAHADIHSYKVFVNPSLSDVVATTTAEALAMGKFVVVVKHPSNEFFSTFPNCMVYSTPEEFSSCLERALDSVPLPMTDDLRKKLTWEAATERLMLASQEPPVAKGPKPAADKILDDTLFAVNNALIGVEPIRRAFGAGVDTKRDPRSLLEIPDLRRPEQPTRKPLCIPIAPSSPRDSRPFLGPDPPGPTSNPMRQIHLTFLESMRQLPSATGSGRPASTGGLPDRRVNTLPDSQVDPPALFPWSRTPVSMGAAATSEDDKPSARP